MTHQRRPYGINQWFRHVTGNEQWKTHAACHWHQHLPWISAAGPAPEETQTMATICASCPVLALCAAHAPDTYGGFYAGVWLPWRDNGSGTAKQLRRRAHRQLKHVVQQHQQPAMAR